jgi:ubiquinol-cytochrome c reductase cytochrome b subunit
MGILDWLESRTGIRRLIRSALYEHVPGGARWRYVWGSTLTFAISVQFITGAILWMAYSPSAQTAWESVHYINDVMPGGWWLRGIHHFMAQLMVPLLVLHFMQVIVDGAYKAPREFNYWFGLGLLVLTLALSLTGYLLPWDQKGYWATKVATNLAGGTPVVGGAIQRVIVGDADYGHHTLTRFFALHAGILPAALVGLIVLHIALFRKHGITPAEPRRKPDAMFWPDQVLKDAVACIAVMGAVLGLMWYFKGADLGAPANPAEPFDAARPDWYFMALFQFLEFKCFQRDGWFGEHGLIVASLIIPGLVFGLLALMPFIGRWKTGHVANCVILAAGMAGYGWLTYVAFSADAKDPIYKAAVAQSHKDAARAKQLAKERKGIPAEGALALLRDDPLTQGPRIFADKCASCHSYAGHNGMGSPLKEKQTAADLAGFGTREWLTAFLDPAQISTTKFWGGTAFVKPPEGKKVSKMVSFVHDDVANYTPEDKAKLAKIILALSAEAKLPAQRDADARDAALIAEGKKLLSDGELTCTDCHTFHSDDIENPDLTGWAGRQWLTDIIKNPAHERLYGKRNDRMPAFGEPGRLSEQDLDMLIRWMRGE